VGGSVSRAGSGCSRWRMHNGGVAASPRFDAHESANVVVYPDLVGLISPLAIGNSAHSARHRRLANRFRTNICQAFCSRITPSSLLALVNVCLSHLTSPGLHGRAKACRILPNWEHQRESDKHCNSFRSLHVLIFLVKSNLICNMQPQSRSVECMNYLGSQDTPLPVTLQHH
jgi:hypothetical protein